MILILKLSWRSNALNITKQTISRKKLHYVKICLKANFQFSFSVTIVKYYVGCKLLLYCNGYSIGVLAYHISLVMSLSETFKKAEVQNASVLTSIESIRTQADCPLLCMSYPSCSGFVFDDLDLKCSLLGCNSNNNTGSSMFAYMMATNNFLARGEIDTR